MLRTIGSVILGYLVMFIVVFSGLTAAYLAMGADRAFQPGVYKVTAIWLVVMFAISILAAFAGGKVCALVAKSGKAVFGLAGLVLILGLLTAIPSLTAPGGEAKPRASDVPNLEAMMKAEQPAWVALLLPVIGVAGVLAGGRRKPGKAAA
jgi:hypothetical protein